MALGISAIFVNGPLALLLREMILVAAPATEGIVTRTKLLLGVERLKDGAASGPDVSHVVTSAGTEKSSTTPPGPPLPEFDDWANAPTPWLAKARQMIARFSPPVISVSAESIEFRMSTKEGLHGASCRPRKVIVSAKRPPLLTAFASGPLRPGKDWISVASNPGRTMC